MKVTGYQLQHAVREWGHALAIVNKQWKDSLFAFPGEEGTSPQALMERFRAYENKIAALQTAQARYNLAVTLHVQGVEMTLCEAVKKVSGAGRAEKMWRSAATDTGRDKYSGREMTRREGEIVAVRQVSEETATAAARRAGRYASDLRAAIQVANATEVEIEEVSVDLFN